VNKSYVNAELKGLYVDIIYRCKTDGKDRYIPILLLTEDQSVNQEHRTLQILQYLTSLIEDCLNKGKPFDISPILLNHGAPISHSSHPDENECYVEQLMELLLQSLLNRQERIMSFRAQLECNGERQGMELGIQLAWQKVNREQAKKLLAHGIEHSIVKEVTGLSDDELNTL
jgi:predicted transposase YdaD